MQLFTFQLEDSEYEELVLWAHNLRVAKSVIARLAIRRLFKIGYLAPETALEVHYADGTADRIEGISDAEMVRLPWVARASAPADVVRPPK